jgi:TolA-binding protein
MKSRHVWRAAAALAAALLGGTPPGLRAAPAVIQASGQRIEGLAIKAKPDGTILLTTKEGELSFPKGTRVVVDQPPTYAKAVQLMQQKQYDEAVRLLQGIVKEYAFLDWDLKAHRLLAGALVGKGEPKLAVESCEAIFRAAPEARKDEELQRIYLRAMAGAGETQKLAPMLDQAIAEGARETAAVAQVLRADLRLAAGDIEGALYDCLRTAELFTAVSDVQAEALFKAAECLEKLGDERAGRYYGKVARDFPQSPYAVKARGKMAAAVAP